MPIRDLLVVIESTPASDARLQTAVALARRHDARLTGLHVMPFPEVAPYLDSAILDRVTKLYLGEALRAAAVLEQSFRDQAGKAGLEAEWRLVRGAPAEAVPLHARYADLAVVGQRDPSRSEPLPYILPEDVAFYSGRPTLVVPTAGKFENFGRRVLVAWNGSREAARAVHDAMLFLEAAEDVTVLAAESRRGISGEGDQAAADLVRHLKRHGVRATAEQVVPGEMDVGDLLLTRAAELGSDLLVMGAYGRSRLREVVLGGATRTMLQDMTLPVLMAH